MPNVSVKGVANTMQFPDDMPLNDIKAFLSNKFNGPIGGNLGDPRVRLGPGGEIAATIASGIVAEPLAGLAGITQSINPFAEPGAGAKAVKSVQDTLSFQPKTEKGKKGLQAVGQFLQPLGDIIQGAETNLGDIGFEKFGTIGGTIGQTIPTAMLEALGLKSLNILKTPVSKSDLFAIRSFVGGVGKVPKLEVNTLKGAKSLVDDVQAKYTNDIKPLQDEFKNPETTPERKSEILRESKELRQPLDAAKSNLFRMERKSDPKPQKEIIKPRADKSFKGTVFHQTDQSFGDFDFNKSADGTIWFTNNKKNFSDPASSASAASGKGRIIEKTIELKKAATFDDLDKFSVGELVQQGFDGAILGGDIQVFNPSAIKTKTTTPKLIGEFKRLAKEKNVSVSLSKSKTESGGDAIILDKIIVNPNTRNQGVGTELMNDLISKADNNNITLALTPSKDFGGNVTRLKKFYKSLGFVENKGTNKDFGFRETFIRLPK